MSKKVTALSAERKRRERSEAFEWVPNEDGYFWSLHKKGELKISIKGIKGYIGYVFGNVSCKPGGKYCKTHGTMREAAKRVESWVKKAKR